MEQFPTGHRFTVDEFQALQGSGARLLSCGFPAECWALPALDDRPSGLVAPGPATTASGGGSPPAGCTLIATSRGLSASPATGSLVFPGGL